MATQYPLFISNGRVAVFSTTDQVPLTALQELHAGVVTSPMQFQLMSPLSRWQSFQLASGVSIAYFVYVGYTVREITANFVAMQVLVTGDPGAGVAMGVYSSTDPPNKAGQTLTQIVATTALDNDGTVAGMWRNTTDFATIIPEKTHLWAAFGIKLSGTTPFVTGLSYDFAEGQVLVLNGDWDLTGLPTVAGDLIVVDTLAVAPDARLEVIF